MEFLFHAISESFRFFLNIEGDVMYTETRLFSELRKGTDRTAFHKIQGERQRVDPCSMESDLSFHTTDDPFFHDRLDLWHGNIEDIGPVPDRLFQILHHDRCFRSGKWKEKKVI